MIPIQKVVEPIQINKDPYPKDAQDANDLSDTAKSDIDSTASAIFVIRKSSIDEVTPEDVKAAQNFVVAINQFIQTQITPEKLDNR